MCARVDQSKLSAIELGRRRMLDFKPRREVFQGQALAFLRPVPGRKTEAVAGRWGLVHRDATEILKKYHTFNAKAETIDELATFRDSFKDRRAVIPLDGFYEHADKIPGKPQLMGICSMKEEPLWAAGLWEWNERLQLTSVTMITGEPNSLVARVHSRMPILLDAGDIPAWLQLGGKDLLKPFPAERLAMMYMDGLPPWDKVRENQARLNAAQAWHTEVSRDMGGSRRPRARPE